MVHALPVEFEGRCPTLVQAAAEENQTYMEPFQQSLHQFNQTAETRYYSAKREDKEHLCDYLNRLNGHARNAGLQSDIGGRNARDHVKMFLETCGDRGLERRLCHICVNDKHELDDMIMEILRIDERNTTK
ncbi:hypothetical protein PHMEG_0004821 [Phytophthora megakarya]|uniref:Retrotransposon gag domain-containing protein n=1 Tax=Phytophthora megakarya TaxID=4795 RepID=A0A225WSW3_9STRA|nr:hypothetical protein PHMEG_0004821 [Phytophthora megakarya]